MVGVIERREDAGQDGVFDFKVYTSRKDGRVLGYLKPYGIVDGNIVTWVKTDFGVEVRKAFDTVLQLADR